MRTLLLFGAGVGFAALGAGCFSERAGTNSIVTPDLECSIPISAIQSGHTIIAVRDFTFQPDSVAVAPGTTVTWVNCEDQGTEPHTTTGDAGGWDSGLLSPGASFSHTFATATGSPFTYHCEPHPFMVGKVVVQ